MLFSTTRFFSRAAIAFEEAAAKTPRKVSDATLAKRQSKLAATAPVKKPLPAYLAFIKEKGRYPSGTNDFGSAARENAAAWAKLSDAEKKAFSPTKEATEEYHQTLTKWYNSLSPEVQAVAVNMKGFPKSLIKTPSQVAWAENQEKKPNAWIAFLTHYRATNNVEGISVTQVATDAAKAYRKQNGEQEQEEYEEDDAEEQPRK